MAVVPIKPGVKDTDAPPPNEVLIEWLEELLAQAHAGTVRTCLCVYVPDGHTAERFHVFETEDDLAGLVLGARRASAELEAEDQED
jgi:hypothetical protein